MSDQGLSIFDEPDSGDGAADETQALPVTPKDAARPEPKSDGHPGHARRASPPRHAGRRGR